jgi:hypothetical protein
MMKRRCQASHPPVELLEGYGEVLTTGWIDLGIGKWRNREAEQMGFDDGSTPAMRFGFVAFCAQLSVALGG